MAMRCVHIFMSHNIVLEDQCWCGIFPSLSRINPHSSSLRCMRVQLESMMRPFIVIVAATASSLSIGRHGKLPWRLSQDMLYFKNVTSNTTTKGRMNAVIMGRRTWESIPQKFRPLSNRLNVVLSRNPKIRQELGIPQEVCVFSSLQEALSELSQVAYYCKDFCGCVGIKNKITTALLIAFMNNYQFIRHY